MARTNAAKKGAGGGHNPSPYMRRFQLPALSFSDPPPGYDELLSPLETDSKHQLIEEKNRQLCDYFGSKKPPSSITPQPSPPESLPKTPTFEPPSKQVQSKPPPIPPHRPHPRQRLLEIEKMRMCQQILELERRSHAMYDMLVPSPGTK